MTIPERATRILFDPLVVNQMVLDNRFVRSATMDSMADHGLVSEAEVDMYRELGKGGIGLIISHGLAPTREGLASPGQLGAYSDDAIPSLRKLTAAVHHYGGKIAAQILHGGWMCRPEVTGSLPVGPSAVVHPRSGQPVRELSGDEIVELVEDYVQAARRVVEAGFDGVQLHGAHSWLLSAFMSPVTNQREDQWGGSAEKRTEFVRRICRGIRKMAGPGYPLMIKLGIKDYHPRGKPASEGIATARLLEADGVDALEVSEGLEEDFFHHIRPDAVAPYYVNECRQTRAAVSVPVMLVGGVRTVEDMMAIVGGGVADAVSMCRPFIMDPHLVNRLRAGLPSNSGCTSCNACLGLMAKGRLACVAN
jgi:2,4-dienoyl-CoA reductase-like NADH-dependent reductase (Old Yellow Enzyme family)